MTAVLLMNKLASLWLTESPQNALFMDSRNCSMRAQQTQYALIYKNITKVAIYLPLCCCQ